jgi:RNA polymerase sigma-70 factor (ECF subfamily)
VPFVVKRTRQAKDAVDADRSAAAAQAGRTLVGNAYASGLGVVALRPARGACAKGFAGCESLILMGTVEGLEELYRERYARFCRLIAAVTGDAELAHDAVQSGFARALSSASSWRGEGSLEGWVWRIVLNCARDARATPSVDLAVVVDLPAVVAERDPVLAEALCGLSARRRLVVFLHYYADLRYSDIAEVLGISEGAVGATLAQAREALRTLLAEEVER